MTTADQTNDYDAQVARHRAIIMEGKSGKHPEHVHHFRQAWHAAGFVPLALLTGSKRCVDDGWQNEHLKNPPGAVATPPDPAKMSTGILCLGLRAVDIDFNDPVAAFTIEKLAEKHLGETVRRGRRDSPRCALLFRAAEGAPGKASLKGQHGQIEVMGSGQQIVVDGLHPDSGLPYVLSKLPEYDFRLSDLPAVTESQIRTFLAAAGPLIGADIAASSDGKGTAKKQAVLGAFDALPDSLKLQLVQAAFAAIDNSTADERDQWRNLIWAACDAEARGCEGAVEEARAWARRGAGYDGEPADSGFMAAVDGFDRERGIGVGTLIRTARQAGAGPALDAIMARGKAITATNTFPPLPPLQAAPGGQAGAGATMRLVDPRELDGKAVPERRWIVPDWLPFGYTTAQYGDGGTGKTLLAQQLMTSCATGIPWLGMAAMQCPVLGLFCEDDEEELHRRQDAINAHYGINFSDLGDMRWVSGVGEDNLLISFGHEGVIRLPRFDELTRLAIDLKAKLVVIDTAADTFGGNENDRSQVRQYVGAGLNHLARALDDSHGGAVLLNAHPSRSGMSGGGDGDGGSTAWSNTVRSRWSLTRPKSEGEAQPDSDERILSRKKANYASIGTEIKLRWHRGVMVPVQGAGSFSDANDRARADVLFLELLDATGAANRPVSDGKNAGNYAPKIFAESPNRQGFTKADFIRAMERLFAEQKITMEMYGRKGDQRRRMVRTGAAERSGDV